MPASASGTRSPCATIRPTLGSECSRHHLRLLRGLRGLLLRLDGFAEGVEDVGGGGDPSGGEAEPGGCGEAFQDGDCFGVGCDGFECGEAVFADGFEDGSDAVDVGAEWHGSVLRDGWDGWDVL